MQNFVTLLTKRTGVSPSIYIPMIISSLFLFISLMSCRFHFDYAGSDPGSLVINLKTDETVGIKSLQPTVYLFTGNGPDNASFSLELSDSTARIENLAEGEWTVRVDGLDENHNTLLEGDSGMYVTPYGETQVNIELLPVEGYGNVALTLEWNSVHTVSPAAVATFVDVQGIKTSYSLSITGAGTAETLVSGLATGNYYVSIQLFDSGVLAMGSAWTVRVLKDKTVEVSAVFEDLNKVGERIEITKESFTIAWDPDPENTNPDEYRMYFRSRGSNSWTLLSDVTPQTEPSFMIDQNKLSFGVYEFAVSAVVGGIESELHTSMDDTADPVTGWYVDWNGI